MSNVQQSKGSGRGFTIIEVVLVLAIAGLIFLMVFIALPALQRGQRDAQRKSDLTRVSVQIQNYLSSSRGAIPTSDNISKFIKDYLGGTGVSTAGDEYKDPNGNNYDVRFGGVPQDVRLCACDECSP
jgi:prepilin-type N-terminal cleavage/methylation domain-containing protein